MKSFLIAIVAILTISIPTIAQNNAVTNNLTANERTEYTLKFLVKETTLSQEQMISLRKVMFDSTEKQAQMEESLKNSEPQKIEQTLGEEKTDMDGAIAEILTADQYLIYENIRDNLPTKISSYKSTQQAPPTKN